ncbi:TATA-binding protein-associated factor TAF14 NDAI_0E02220 [Naumovozyma dairenensis CBS 421]|uniref:YEATS domain-containing protein n=1 Tax=Naumovozyma dairenensis (strain ATCC 10597 / BCRC 20456 / CBS 421 / NBRC 0211 / NRRL Y-12639) TaxID=1071378 RepID=G0WBB9_NAUDC|nr:hypothetical protein NDAI_0E02220 [Naumovozyma dairenensis CBS 421]CCD25039.1 hypothetical protein NDAI_0E02220 [Naumovozyma dairenensis CBS 421]
MVPSVRRTIRIKTKQDILPDVPPVEGFPVRKWSIEIVLIDEETKQEIPATIFDKVIYHLHPTFENPNRTVTEVPFKIEEQGWGGFPLDISVFFLEKAGDLKISHDLNFLKNTYEVDHIIQVPINKPLLVTELAKSGPVEDTSNSTVISENGVIGTPANVIVNNSNKRKGSSITSGMENGNEPLKKKSKTSTISTIRGGVDMEKLAVAMTKLNEDDLVGVVQMVIDNKTPEMIVTNNVDEGEFVIDLYSLPEGLLKSLWEYVKKNTE